MSTIESKVSWPRTQRSAPVRAWPGPLVPESSAPAIRPLRFPPTSGILPFLKSYSYFIITNLNGNSTNLVILSLNRMFLNENLLRWMIRMSGRRHTDSCLVASRWALHWGQYLGVSGKTLVTHAKKTNSNTIRSVGHYCVPCVSKQVHIFFSNEYHSSVHCLANQVLWTRTR